MSAIELCKNNILKAKVENLIMLSKELLGWAGSTDEEAESIYYFYDGISDLFEESPIINGSNINEPDINWDNLDDFTEEYGNTSFSVVHNDIQELSNWLINFQKQLLN